jgi:hypothetical protein
MEEYCNSRVWYTRYYEHYNCENIYFLRTIDVSIERQNSGNTDFFHTPPTRPLSEFVLESLFSDDEFYEDIADDEDAGEESTEDSQTESTGTAQIVAEGKTIAKGLVYKYGKIFPSEIIQDLNKVSSPVTYVFTKPTSTAKPIKLVHVLDLTSNLYCDEVIRNFYCITTKEPVLDLDLLELTIQHYLSGTSDMNFDVSDIPPIYEYRPPRMPNQLFQYEDADYTPRSSGFEDLNTETLDAAGDPNYFRIPRPPVRYVPYIEFKPLITPFGYTHSNEFLPILYRHDTREFLIPPHARDPGLCQAVLHKHLQNKILSDQIVYVRELYLQ